MTAFGRASHKTRLGLFSVEIQSVNRKHLELNIVLPQPFTRFESEIRKEIASCVFRGAVTVKISVAPENESPVAIKPNLALLKQYKAAWDRISQELNIPCNTEAFFNVLQSEGNLFLIEESTEHEGEFLDIIIGVLKSALQNFLKMKKDEGNALQTDILLRWHKLKTAIGLIAAKAPEAVQRHRQKLGERLKEIVPENSELDERVLKEIAIYAEKVDVTEEITRFKSHLQQFLELLQSPAEGIGKTLDFIIQELNREINTIVSKSADIDISRLVIESKSEIEKIREQIQNIE